MSLGYYEKQKLKEIIFRSARIGAATADQLEFLKKRGIGLTYVLITNRNMADVYESSGETVIRYFDYPSGERDQYGLQRIYAIWLHVSDEIAMKILTLGELP